MENAFRQGNMKAAKLTPSEVIEIRQLYAAGWTQGALCKKFCVGVNQIGRIVRGESWKTLPATLMTPEELRKSGERLLEVQREADRLRAAGIDPAGEERVQATPGLSKLDSAAAEFARKHFGAFGGVEKALGELSGADIPPPKNPMDE